MGEILKVTVIGAGQMGSGISQVVAQSGFKVSMVDIKEKYIENGKNKIESSLARYVKKGTITEEEKKAIIGRINGTTDLETGASDADLVIEAVLEEMELKKEVFAKLDKICRPEVILATNTSSLSVTEIASSTSRPDKVIGMHFFNPVPMMKLVEIIRGASTSDETVRVIEEVSHKLGKETVEVNEMPGFVTSRMVSVIINEAFEMLQEGLSSPEDIDLAVKLGLNHPMGPLALADLVGLDIVLHVLEYLYEEFGDPKYAPSPLLRKLVRANRLGRKTGNGVYSY